MPKKPVIPIGPYSDREMNIMRGKMLMDHPPGHDVWKVFAQLDWLEDELNQRDMDDFFGTEGWRHAFRHPDAD